MIRVARSDVYCSQSVNGKAVQVRVRAWMRKQMSKAGSFGGDSLREEPNDACGSRRAEGDVSPRPTQPCRQCQRLTQRTVRDGNPHPPPGLVKVTAARMNENLGLPVSFNFLPQRCSTGTCHLCSSPLCPSLSNRRRQSKATHPGKRERSHTPSPSPSLFSALRCVIGLCSAQRQRLFCIVLSPDLTFGWRRAWRGP